MTRRFSIRALLAGLAVLGLLLSWVTSNQKQARIEELAISEIQAKYNGFRVINRSTPLLCGTGLSGIANRNPTNLANRLFGVWWPNTFDYVTTISIDGLRYGSNVMSILEKFPNLRSVSNNRTSVNKKDIESFRRKNLRIAVEVVDPTFELTDENDPSQILESIQHW